MKKVILSLALVSSLSLVSCDGTSSSATGTETPDSTAVCCPDTCAKMNDTVATTVDTTSVVPTTTVH